MDLGEGEKWLHEGQNASDSDSETPPKGLKTTPKGAIPSITHKFEGGIPVVTADLTPRKKRGGQTPTQTRSLSPAPSKPAAKPSRRPLMEVAVTVGPDKEVLLPVYMGDTAAEVANRLKCESKQVQRSLAEEVEREIDQYMTGIAKELSQFQRLSKETQAAKSKSALDKAKPPNLHTAQRARTKDRPLLGSINVDSGSGTALVVTVREGDKAIDLAMQFCTQNGFSHSHLEELSTLIQELISSSDRTTPRFRVMLEVAAGRLAPLEVRLGDDLHLLATRFVEEYHLGKHLIRTIYELLVRTEAVHEARRLIKVSEVTHFDT